MKQYPAPPFDGAVAIYALSDPRTGATRYIGKSVNPWQRYDNHLVSAKDRQHIRSRRWIASLLGAGLRPTLTILDWATQVEWRDAERRHIAAARQSGADLTNHTDGGDGSAGLTPSTDTRAKMSAAHTARWAHDDARRTAMSEALLGRGIVQATRETRADWTRRAWAAASPERRAQASETGRRVMTAMNQAKRLTACQ